MSGRAFNSDQMSFMQGGGDAGAILRARDWSETPLGAPDAWPQALKTLVGVVLSATQPMLIVWGRARTIIYNDGYSVLCGSRHPRGFGGAFEAMWHDVWPEVEPIITRGYAGEATHMDDLALIVTRNGFPENVHFSFGFTPVRDDSGAVAGLFCACKETTRQVRAAAEVREREERLRLVIEGGKDHAIITTDLDGIITSWSAGAEAIFGWSATEAIGRSCGIIYKPQDLQEDAERLGLQTAARDGIANDARWHVRKASRRVSSRSPATRRRAAATRMYFARYRSGRTRSLTAWTKV